MCIREVRVYRCPALNGVSVHRFKYNNLCAKLSVCPKDLWERREVYLQYHCPACGGTSEMARPKTGGPISISPKITSLGYDDLHTPDGNLVDLYIGQWAHYLSLNVATGLSRVNRQAADVCHEHRDEFLAHWMQMREEEQCKEHSHKKLTCSCLAQLDALGMFAFNPASALRYQVTSRMHEFMLGSKHIKDRELGDLVKKRYKVMQESRLKPGVLFREGRARQPPRTQEEVEEIGLHFEALSKKAQEDAVARMVAESPGVTPSDEAHKHNLNICRTLATFMAEDVGLTRQRLDCILERLVRGACGLEYCHPLLEKLCQKVDTFLKLATIETARTNAAGWVGIYRRRWELEELVYKRLDEVMETTAVLVTDEEFKALDDHHQECPLCYSNYYENPDQRKELQSPELRAAGGGGQPTNLEPAVLGEGDIIPVERGEGDNIPVERKKFFGSFFQKTDDFSASEIPVRIIGCGHIFGRRCLFNHWASVLPGGRIRCPVCRDVVFTTPDVRYFAPRHTWGIYQFTEAESAHWGGDIHQPNWWGRPGYMPGLP